jgi:4-hydroxy-tetrahydrodipicolinate synthase
MDREALKEKLVGVVVSLPTFCDHEHRVQIAPFRRHVRWLIERGIRTGSGVLLGAGGLGEGYFLTDDEFRALAEALVEEAAGRVPTMVGIFDLNAREAARKARYAASVGVDFIQLAPPHYMLPSEEDIITHFRYVHDAAPIGIMAYHTPWAMPAPGYEFSPRLLEHFLELERIVGIKWASFDVWHYTSILRLFGDRFAFIDNMLVLSLGFRLGARGFIDFFANVAPRLSLTFWELLKQRRYDEFDALYLRLRFDPFIRLIRPEHQRWIGVGEGPTSRLWLRLFGMETGPAFPPQAPLSPEYEEAARRALEHSGLREWVEWSPEILAGR